MFSRVRYGPTMTQKEKGRCDLYDNFAFLLNLLLSVRGTNALTAL